MSHSIKIDPEQGEYFARLPKEIVLMLKTVTEFRVWTLMASDSPKFGHSVAGMARVLNSTDDQVRKALKRMAEVGLVYHRLDIRTAKGGVSDWRAFWPALVLDPEQLPDGVTEDPRITAMKAGAEAEGDARKLKDTPDRLKATPREARGVGSRGVEATGVGSGGIRREANPEKAMREADGGQSLASLAPSRLGRPRQAAASTGLARKTVHAPVAPSGERLAHAALAHYARQIKRANDLDGQERWMPGRSLLPLLAEHAARQTTTDLRDALDYAVFGDGTDHGPALKRTASLAGLTGWMHNHMARKQTWDVLQPDDDEFWPEMNRRDEGRLPTYDEVPPFRDFGIDLSS